MLLKKLRLNTEAFNTVFEQGKTLRTEQFHARFLAISKIAEKSKRSSQQSRFAVVVSKKHVKTAVARNRLRRRIYAVLEKMKLSTPTTYSVIIMTQKQTGDLSPIELTAAVKGLLEKIAPVHYT